MERVAWIGMDTSKRVFQVHGVDAQERPVLRRKLSREAMLAFKGLAPTVVAIEACGSAHHWARVLGAGSGRDGPRGQADRAAVGQALREAGQERRRRG